MEFTGPLQTEWLERGRKRLLEPFRYSVGEKGSKVFIEAERGFISDGTSVPWIMQWLIRKDGGEFPCSVIHDKGYKSGKFSIEFTDPDDSSRVFKHDEKVTQAMVDSAFREAMRIRRRDGTLEVHPIRREILYWGLVIGGFMRWRELRHKDGRM